MAEGREEDIPRDAKIIKTLLKSMNVDDYEPGVGHQFLELWYRYVVDVLTDAHVYSEHCGKSKIDSDDVKLAIQSKVNFSLSQPPPRQMLLELARSRNKNPLPKSIAQYGIPLPPEQDTLISPNYQLAIPKMQGGQPDEETEEDEEGVDPNPTALPASNLSQDCSALPTGRPNEYRFLLELNIQDNFLASATASRSKQEPYDMDQKSYVAEVDSRPNPQGCSAVRISCILHGNAVIFVLAF